MRTLQERRAKYMSTAPIYEALLISARQACAVANQNGRRTGPAAVQLLLVALSPVRDLLFCAKHLFIAARRSSSQRSLTGHLNRGTDGVFEIVRVVGRGLVSIAEVHAIVARAHLAQSEPEMSRDRFGFLERHDAVHWRFRFLVALPPASDLLLCAKHLFVAAMVVAIAPAEGSRMSNRSSSAPNSEQGLASIPMAGGGLSRLAVARLESAGVPVAPLLKRAGLTPELIADPEQRLSV